MRVTRETVDPQLWRVGQLLRKLGHDRTEEQLRSTPALMRGLDWVTKRRPPANLDVTEEWATRPDGTRLRLLVVTPLEPQAGVPGVLWLHGGGYAGGSPEGELRLGSQLITLSDCVLVSPDYRLSREAPYPAALDDAMLALHWLRDNAARLGVRSDQLVVAGASAGGGLTAAVTLRARDEGEIAIAFQMPLFPMIDDRCDTPSARECDAPVWDAETNRNAWKLYLGDLSGGDVPAYAAPSRATDYSGLPPTFTYVGDQEPFLDETVAYAEALEAAGVDVTWRVFPGAYHGFEVVSGARVSVTAKQLRDRWFRKAVATYFAEQPG